jgi:hypothetical protein
MPTSLLPEVDYVHGGAIAIALARGCAVERLGLGGAGGKWWIPNEIPVALCTARYGDDAVISPSAAQCPRG